MESSAELFSSKDKTDVTGINSPSKTTKKKNKKRRKNKKEKSPDHTDKFLNGLICMPYPSPEGLVQTADEVISILDNLLKPLQLDRTQYIAVVKEHRAQGPPETKREKEKSLSSLVSRNLFDVLNDVDAVENATAPPNRDYALKNKKKKKVKIEKNEYFENYWDVKDVKAGLENGTLVKGSMRIGQWNKKAYITAPLTKGVNCNESYSDLGNSLVNIRDILIDGAYDKNRALNGDSVVVQIKPKSSWKKVEDLFQKTAKVVYIEERLHSWRAVGSIDPPFPEEPDWAFFWPIDKRMPQFSILMSQLPEGFQRAPEMYLDTLFVGQITEWTHTRFAMGKFVAELGERGELSTEVIALLYHFGLDTATEQYDESLYAEYISGTYTVPQAEIDRRTDLRKACIFSIDPPKVMDLDDAISVHQLSNGNLEVGVHIADVAYFMAEGSPLDIAVSRRATSIYMVQSVYHMLPIPLSRICSLTPGKDKLAFSILFEISADDARVVNTRVVRSVIHSCAQLSYADAQAMIDMPARKWDVDDLPRLYGGYTARDISAAVNQLQHLARMMSARRFSEGALRIDKPELAFALDPETGYPTSVTVLANVDSKRLIEEFMVLANITVAQLLLEKCPQTAMLRSHAHPNILVMAQTTGLLAPLGIHLETATAGTLQASIHLYCDGDDSGVFPAVLSKLCIRSMAAAKYFCAGMCENNVNFHHYALNVDLYTHFTSPIRRYADIMVHRQLAGALGYSEAPSASPQHTQRIATQCNVKSYAAKRASEECSNLYLAFYLGQKGPLVCEAAVLDVRINSLNVVILSLGVVVLIHFNKMSGGSVKFNKEGKISCLTITWELAKREQVICVSSIVRVQLSKSEDGLKIEAMLVCPKDL